MEGTKGLEERVAPVNLVCEAQMYWNLQCFAPCKTTYRLDERCQVRAKCIKGLGQECASLQQGIRRSTVHVVLCSCYSK